MRVRKVRILPQWGPAIPLSSLRGHNNKENEEQRSRHEVRVELWPVLVISMSDKICKYCTREFRPSRYRPDQQVCSLAGCQLRRRTDYHRQKLATDAAYREQCRDSRAKWREKNPEYMKRYAARRRVQAQNDTKPPLIEELRRLLKLVKNNVALDLRSLDANVWFVFPRKLLSEKNTLARAKVIIVQGLLHTAG
jgi:hypothetical protein